MELDKTGLNDRAFEAFARTSDREYFYPVSYTHLYKAFLVDIEKA